MRFTRLILAALVACGTAAHGAAKDYPVTPVPFTRVHVTGGFWQQKMTVAVDNLVPYNLRKCEETGRISNFAVKGGLEQGRHQGAGFNDSDLAKILEGAAYCLAAKPDPKLEKYTDEIIRKIISGQESDGYLYTEIARGDLASRWIGLGGSHEMYCAGHMMEAAVAYYQATGKRALLDAMTKNADLICKSFNEQGIQQPDGHEEVELALVKLYRATGNENYLRQAKFFTDQRGRKDRKNARGEASGLYGTYGQDHIPVIEQDKAVGHAVRGAYLYCAMADIAAIDGDPKYKQAVDKIWENVVGKQMYVTGTIGSSWALGEAFGGDYDLPNLTGYCETCGSIADALWNYRMFLLHGDGKYMDVFERCVYNGFLSGMGLDGKSYYYTNPLGSIRGNERAPWFDCACCPSNDSRFLPGMPGFAYAVKGASVYVNLFMTSNASVKTPAGTVGVKQETDYPWDGKVKITISPAKSARFALRVRIPGWAQDRPVPSTLYTYADKSTQPITLKLNGKPITIKQDSGYAVLDRKWKKGDVVELGLPMPVRKLVADPACKWDGGKVVLERGPIVYCVEGIDVPNKRVFSLMVPDSAEFKSEFKKDLLGGVVVLSGKVQEAFRKADLKSIETKDEEITAIPMYAYANRGRYPVAIWLGRDESGAQPVPYPTIANQAKVAASQGRGYTWSLCDQLAPNGFGLDAMPSLTWWPRSGALEWVQYDFSKPEMVSKAKVYWFDDRPLGGVRVPESWRVLYNDGDVWRPVANHDPYSLDLDKLIEVNFDPVTTSAIRFEVQSIKTHSSGVYEMTVE